jgi:hypothetical protein
MCGGGPGPASRPLVVLCVFITAFVLACWLGIEHGYAQDAGLNREDDYVTFDERQHAQSLVQLVQSARSPVDKLKSDLLAIFKRQPHWKNIAKYIALTDHLGYALYGLDDNKWLSKILRRMASTFVVKDFKIDFAEDHLIESLWKNGKMKKEIHQPGQSLLAQWTIKLDTKKSWFSSARPIVLEGETNFRFNNYGQLVFAQVDNCFVDGLAVMLWPDVSTRQNLKTNMQKIGEWIEDAKILSEKKASIFKDDSLGLVYNVGTIPPTEEIEMVMRKLKNSLANVFRKTPSWNIFADNFTITDHAGKALKGLESNQNLTQLLRNLPKEFAVKDFNIHFVEMSEMYSSYHNRRLKAKSQMPINLVEEREGSILLAEWSVKLDDFKGFAFWKKTTPVVIGAETLFQVNLIDDEIKIDRMEIRKFFVNGDALEAWPDVDLIDSVANSTMTIREWADAMKPQKEVVDEEAEPEDGDAA